MEKIKVLIAGHTTPSGTAFTVHSQVLGNKPPELVRKVKVIFKKRGFYDVSVDGISDGTATVSITTDAFKPKEMQYWREGEWVDVEHKSAEGNTISGDIPVRYLHGTPIVIGT